MKSVITGLLLLYTCMGYAQNDRVNDYNTVGWLQFFGTKKAGKKTDVLLEYQWRRSNLLRNWQQSLLRTGFQYRAGKQLSFAIGYAWVKTFTYGDYPIAANGPFSEHRLYEEIKLKQALGKLQLTQRLRIEQRWNARLSAAGKTDEWIFVNRFRLLTRIQYPIADKWYAWCGDELFIQAGRNVGVNIFDQNRLHCNLGYTVNKNLAVELGYLNQTVQQGKRVSDKVIMQRNNGLVLAGYLNL